jgi:hypothetical protein
LLQERLAYRRVTSDCTDNWTRHGVGGDQLIARRRKRDSLEPGDGRVVGEVYQLFAELTAAGLDIDQLTATVCDPGVRHERTRRSQFNLLLSAIRDRQNFPDKKTPENYDENQIEMQICIQGSQIYPQSENFKESRNNYNLNYELERSNNNAAAQTVPPLI